MHYVYLIRSIASPSRTYIGFTSDLRERIAVHNAGGSKHTAKYAPWELVSYHAFANEKRAREFEYYLKTGSGQAFAKKRLW
jgi:putative endonuclease